MQKRFVDNAVAYGPTAQARYKDSVEAARKLLEQGTDHLVILQVDAVSDEVGQGLQRIGHTQQPLNSTFNPYTTAKR